MVARLTGGKSLPAAVVQHIVEKTDGVPLYIEEMTKAILESGVLQEVNGQYELIGSFVSLAIPTTLHDSLMARLDRLGAAKGIAQLGATLGRQFVYEVLQAVSLLDETTVQRELGRLVEAELLYQRGVPPQATYTFKHALIQDTAYQSLLKITRQQYHQRIAHVLVERFPETVGTQPELVAYHYTEAGLMAQAVPHWQRAGQRAMGRSAYMEAVTHLTKGLEVLNTLPDTSMRAQRELNLQLALGRGLIITKGYAAPEVEYIYTRAYTLCQQIEDASQLFNALRGLWNFYIARAQLQTAQELGMQLLDLAQRLQAPALLLAAHLALGQTAVHLGIIAQAHTHFGHVVDLYNPQESRRYAVQDPLVTCHSYAAHALWHLGYPDQARKRINEALTLARELSSPYSLVFALTTAGAIHCYLREPHAVQKWAEAVLALSAEHEFPYTLAQGKILRGWALAAQNQGAEGIVQAEEGLAAFQAIGAVAWRVDALLLLAEAHENVRQPLQGMGRLDEAMAQAGQTEERLREAEVHRLKGKLLLSLSPDHSAESAACFHQALDIARRQQAKFLELQAATSLARLWQQQGKRQQACDLLAPIYGWFTEGFDTADLQDARTLLEELA
jgi:predicted ATPase